jgi:HK97 family phage portal protein
LKLLGFHVPFTKATDQNTLTPIGDPVRIASRWGWISEAFGGMWQRNLVIDNTQSLLAFSAVYACLALISGDVAKLRFMLLRLQADGTWREFESAAFSPVLRKPNRYQTRLQFIEQWLLSKLIWGNTYVLKERDDRGVVIALYVLDAQRVTPLVAPDGDVFYQINEDTLAGVPAGRVSVPASEIIHDRAKCLFHPLIGVPPLYACATSTSQGNRIQTNSSLFFENMSRPSGHLTAPGTIDDETAERMKREFEKGFSGSKIGRLLVTGNSLKYEPFTMPADQAQLIEQLGWTVEDVARAYLVPLYKISASKDFKANPETDQEYYKTTLQPHIDGMELLLDEGLKLPSDVTVELDVDALLRMDPKARFAAYESGVKAGVIAPNEARLAENKSPVAGGETPYLQQQNYSLAALAKRDAKDDPFTSGEKPTPPALPKPSSTDEEDAAEEMRSLLKHITEGLAHEH